MAAGVETTAAEAFLIQTLKAAGVAGGRVYSYVAPIGTIEPFVIVQEASPGTGVLYAIGAHQIWLDPLFDVKAVKATGSWTELTPTVKQIHAALQGATGALADGIVISCLREEVVKKVDPPVGGVIFRHLGNSYRVRVQ